MATGRSSTYHLEALESRVLLSADGMAPSSPALAAASGVAVAVEEHAWRASDAGDVVPSGEGYFDSVPFETFAAFDPAGVTDDPPGNATSADEGHQDGVEDPIQALDPQPDPTPIRSTGQIGLHSHNAGDPPYTTKTTSLATPEIWSGGEEFVWGINDANGTEGQANGWDLLNIAQTLQIQATAANKFNLRIRSLNGTAAGTVADFNVNAVQSWRIVQTTGGITGFDRSAFNLDTTGFQPGLGTGAFLLDLSNNGNDLILRYVPSLPFATLNDPAWLEAGPSLVISNAVEGMKPGVVSGALTAVAVHPANPDIVYVGAANGGVWRTTNVSNPNGPDWTPLTDQIGSLAIGSLAIHPFAATSTPNSPVKVDANTPVSQLVIYAGTGLFSNGFAGGRADGLYVSRDGGGTWSRVAQFDSQRISSIVPSDQTTGLVLLGVLDSTADGRASSARANVGLYQSTDGGNTWASAGIMGGRPISDIVRIPGTDTYYVAVAANMDLDADGINDDAAPWGNKGIQRGQWDANTNTFTWTDVSTSTSGLLLPIDFNGNDDDQADGVDEADRREGIKLATRIRLATTPADSNVVFAAIAHAVTGGESLVGIFRSSDQGAHWAPLGTPPPSNAGNQAFHNLALVADPVDSNLVYVGGDRPPDLFRGDFRTAGLISFTASGGTFQPNTLLPFIRVPVADGNAGEAGVLITETNGDTALAEGGTDSYQVVLRKQPTADVRVNASSARPEITVRDSANASNSFLIFTPANWSTPQSFSVTAPADNVREQTRAITVDHAVVSADLSYHRSIVRSVSVQYSEGPGIRVIQPDGITLVAEGGGPDTLQIVLRSQPSTNITVRFLTPAPWVADDGGSPAQNFVVFTPADWNQPKTVRLQVPNDNVVDPLLVQPRLRFSLQPAQASEPDYFNGSPSIPANEFSFQFISVDANRPGITVIPTGGSTEVTESSGSDTFWVVANRDPGGTATVTLSPNSQIQAANDATQGNTLTFTSADWFVPQLVRVTAVADATVEQDTWRPIVRAGANGTMPHPDSRQMVFDQANASGSILQLDDGGIYRLVNPRASDTSIRWSSLNGDLAVSEVGNSVAWDSLTNSIIAGTQDNGVQAQDPVFAIWDDVTGGDGNYVGVDNTDPTRSVRYLFSNNFAFFFRRSFSATGEINPVFRKVENVVAAANGVRISSAGHGLAVGDRVAVSGLLGVPSLASSGIVQVSAIPDVNTFELADVPFSGTYVSGGVWRKFNPVTSATLDGTDIVINAPNHNLTNGSLVLLATARGTAALGLGIFAVTQADANSFRIFGISGESVDLSQIAFWSHNDRLLLAAGARQGNWLSGLDNVIRLNADDQTDRNFEGFAFIPLAVNAVQGGRIALGRNALYESSDFGNTITNLTSGRNGDPHNGVRVTALAFGGRDGNTPMPDVMYVARGRQVAVRTQDGRWNPARTHALPGASAITDIVLDPQNWQRAVAIDRAHVWITVDGGRNWHEITANLGNFSGQFASGEVLNQNGALALLVGTRNGVFRTVLENPAAVASTQIEWARFGSALPNALVVDLDYSATDDVLVAGTMGRGSFVVDSARAQIFSDGILRVELTNASDVIRIALADEQVNQPRRLDLFLGGNPTPFQSVPFNSLRQVLIHGNAGDDQLIVDQSKGQVALPDGIRFEGGDGTDTVAFAGNDPAIQPQTVSAPGLTVIVLGTQVVTATGVEPTPPPPAPPTPAPATIVSQIGGGVDQLGRASRRLDSANLLGRSFPAVGETLGSALNRVNQNAIIGLDDPRTEFDTLQAQDVLGSIAEDFKGLIQRLFEDGPITSLAGLAEDYADPAALELALEGLDEVDDNVSYNAGTQTFEVGIDRRLGGSSALSVEVLGGLVTLSGTMDVSVRVQLQLTLGVDAYGLWVSTQGGPELVLSDLRVDGTVAGAGQFGFLSVSLDGASLEFDSDARIEVDLVEPAADMFTNVADQRLRMHEFEGFGEALFEVEVIGDPTDAYDIKLTGDFSIAAVTLGGEPMFNLGTARVSILWPDLNDPIRVRLEAAGGVGSTLLRFLNFSMSDLYGELRGFLGYLGEVGGTAALDVELPFGGGLSLGASFDFSTAFFDRVYADLVDIELAASLGDGTPGGDLALGRLSADAVFTLSVSDGAPVTVTVTKASTGGNGGLLDLVDDFNAALAGAGLGSKVEARLDGGQLVLRLVEGTGLRIGGEASSVAFGELGFRRNTFSVEVPRLPTLQSLIARLQVLLDPDGPGPLQFTIIPAFDVEAKTLSFAIAFSYDLTRQAGFKYDPAIGLGDLADLELNGAFEIDLGVSLAFTLGLDFNAVGSPQLATSFFVPPPSSGVVHGSSSFTIVVNDSSAFEFSWDATATTSGNSQLEHLVTDLNTVLALSAHQFNGKAIQDVLRFRRDGSAIVLEPISTDGDGDGVLDLGPDGVTALAVESGAADPMRTEVGFNSLLAARSPIEGLFLEDVVLKGAIQKLTLNGDVSARFAVFGLEAGASATGSAAVLVALRDPTPETPELATRVDLDELLKNVSNFGSYLSPESGLSGSLDVRLVLDGVTPLLPGMVNPAGSEVRVFIPDIKELTYNPAPYDGTNKGVFVTYPDLGSLFHFNCLTAADVAILLDSVADQLEGLRGFSFLNEPLPLIDVSVGDVLDFGAKLAETVKKLAQGDAATLDEIELEIETALGIPSSLLSFEVVDTPTPETDGSGVAKFNPTGGNNALVFTGSVGGGVKVDFVDDGTLAAGTDTAAVSYAGGAKVLTVRYNASYTRAKTVRDAVNTAHTANATAMPFTVALDAGAEPGNTGEGRMTETALTVALGYSLAYGKYFDLALNLGQLAGLVTDPGVKAFLEGVAQVVQLEGSAKLNVTAGADLVLKFGIDVSNPCHWLPYLDDSTGLTLRAAIRGTNLTFKAGIGSLGVFVKNGTVTLDKDGDPTTTGAGEDAEFHVGFKDNNGDGRHYFFRDGETFFDGANIGITLSAGASAVLPLYFPVESISLGGSGDEDGNGFADNALVVSVPDLVGLFEGVAGSVTIATPDISGLFANIDLCDLVTHADLLLDGLDALLGRLQEGLSSRVFNRNLPLVGDKLGKAADFIGDFRAGLLADMRSKLAEVGDPIGLVQEAIFNVLGQPGLDLLVRTDGTELTTYEEVEIVCQGNAIDFKLRLKKAVAVVDTSGDPIGFDVGIPGLGLEVDGNVRIEVGFDLKLYFGVSTSDGFYFDTSDSEELVVDFKVTIPGMKATGELFFLQLDVSDEADGKDLEGNARAPSSFQGFFKVDLKDPAGSGDKLTMADMASGAFDFDAFVDPALGAVAELNLDLAISFGGDARFPRIVAEFDLDWEWEVGQGDGGELTFGFHHIALDIGSFISDFVQPILRELREITEPLQPVVDILTYRLPVISDVAGRDYTLLDLAETWGMISPGTRKFIDVLIVIVELANDTSVANNGSILLPLGDFNLDLDAGGTGAVGRKAGDVDRVADLKETKDESAFAFLDSLEEIGITFPFLSTKELFKLFRGEPVSLVEYALPVLDFEASIALVIPIFGPLVAKFGGSIGAYAAITIGYDTFGLQKYFNSEERNALDIFDGFYVKDVDDDGVDVPELVLSGALTASGTVDLVAAEAGVRGGLEAEIGFNLNDPDEDGRVRISEIVANAKEDIRCIFDIHGELTAFFEAYLEVDLGLIQFDESWRIAEVTLLEFDVTCPEPVLASVAGNELLLHLGPNAGLRQYGDVTDGDESFVVKHLEGDPGTAEGETVEVLFNGIRQTYPNVKTIRADGGAGRDTIDLRGVLAPATEVRGGKGDDRIYASRGGGSYWGGDGNDELVGEVADGEYAGAVDTFHGDGGADTLLGHEGADVLHGDAGEDTIEGGGGADEIHGGTGNDRLIGGLDGDTIHGDEGADWLEGNEGADTLLGGPGEDTLLGGADDDRLIGNAGNDFADGGAGSDVVLGDEGVIDTLNHVSGVDGTGNDTMAGGAGQDRLFGAGGNDAIFGGTLLVSGEATVIEPDGEDFIDAGDGNDTVFADDAHAGESTTFPGATVGSRVWFDRLDGNGLRNGVQDGSENGMGGVTVQLYTAANELVGTTVTSGNGTYRFTGLAAGDYAVKFVLPTGLAFTDAGQGTDEDLDSDADPVTGRTAVFTLEAGQTQNGWDAGLKGTQPTVTITDEAVEEGDTGYAELTFTVRLSHPADERVLVCYQTEPGTAQNLLDYETVSGTLVFEPGMTEQTITVRVAGDRIDERDESFQVVLCEVENATLDAQHGTGTGTIIDDDAAPVVTVANGRQVTGNGLPAPEAVAVSFVVRLSNPSWQPITLTVQSGTIVGPDGELVADGALPGVDYSALYETPQLLAFAPGEVERVVQVGTIDDDFDEYDERFALRVGLAAATPANAAVIGDGEAVGTILDDEATPFVQFDPLSLNVAVAEGHAGNTAVPLRINLTHPDGSGTAKASGRPVTVTWNNTRSTAINAPPPGEAADFVQTTQTFTFAPGETSREVTVEVIGDTRVELDEEFFVNLLQAVNGRIDITDKNLNHATVRILNDEVADPGPWYVEFGREGFEVREGGTAEITLVRAAGSSYPTAVYWSIGGTAQSGLDYTGIWEKGTDGPRGMVTFGPGEVLKTFTIPTLDDTIYEGDETVELRLANPTGGPVRGPNGKVELVIRDNEPRPVLSISDAVANESAGTISFTITASGRTTLPVSVDWLTASGTATTLDDYFAVAATTVNFNLDPPDDFDTFIVADQEVVTVTLKNDLDPELTETLRARLLNAQNATIEEYEGEGTILDNDRQAVGGFVFLDSNHNGFFDAGSESGLSGVTVTVSDTGGPLPVQPAPTVNGFWQALVLLGEITVTVDETTTPAGSSNSTGNNPLTSEVTLGVLAVEEIGFGIPSSGTQPDASIGNGGSSNNDTAYGGPGNDLLDGGGGDDWLVGGHWLGPGCACAGDPYDVSLLQQPAEAGGRLYVDPATIQATGSISGGVWSDTSGDGLRQVGEPGQGSIQVNLYDELWTLIATTYTAPDGTYSFTKLTPCNYTVQFLPPAGFAFAPRDAGPDAFDSDADPLTGLTGLVPVGGGAVGNVSAGLKPVPPTAPGQPWNVSFDRVVYSVRETDGQAAITIIAAADGIEPVGVYLTADGPVQPATAGVDYLRARGLLRFGEDEGAKTFDVTILVDNLAEGYETVRLRLQNPTGGPVTGTLPESILLIFDNPCPDNDTLLGHDGDDVILGDFGYFQNGQPVLLGGMGHDQLFGEDGADQLFGQGGNDRLEGGPDDDLLDGGSENDEYLFDGDRSQGGDTLVEGAGLAGGTDTIDLSRTAGFAVTLDLGSVAVQVVTPSLTLTLPGGQVIENLTGGARDDTLIGNSLRNRIRGLAGDDTITGGAGDDELDGGTGNDTYLFDADNPLGHDVVIEPDNADEDTFDFSATTTQPVAVDLSSLVSQAVAPGSSLTLSGASGIEHLHGGAQGDLLRGNARDNRIEGGPGNDQLDGGLAGHDTLVEHRAGNFTLTDTQLLLGPETNTYAHFDEVSLVGDDNPNALDASAFTGTVRLDGRGGADTLIGGTGINYLTGGEGDDTITGGPGFDTLVEERDANFLLTNTTLQIGPGELDTISGIELALLTGGDGSNLLDATAFAGRVFLDGAGGGDTLLGSSQSDVLVGGPGDDQLEGGDGHDFYPFDADGPLGTDKIVELAGGGVDTLSFGTTTTFGVTVRLGLTTLQEINPNLSLVLVHPLSLENLIGSRRDDLLVGDDGPNQIFGLQGHDTLTGGPGADLLDGGADVLFPVPAFWVDRVVETADAPFTLTNTTLTIGAEIDTLVSIEGAVLTGGPGPNLLNALAFTAGSVQLDGADGNDLLLGGTQADLLIGGGGNDWMLGRAGDDTYRFDADTDLGVDALFELAGEGNDTLDYSPTTTARIQLDLTEPGFQNAALTPSAVVRHVLALGAGNFIENITGGALDDTLLGNALGNVLTGLDGNDLLEGRAGDDTLAGGQGDDQYRFNANSPLGHDRIEEQVGTGGIDTLDFSATTTLGVTVHLGRALAQVVNANLTLTLGACTALENLIGGGQADTLTGNALDNVLEGRAGNDFLSGGRGRDTYRFDADTPLGTDTLGLDLVLPGCDANVAETPDLEGGIDTLDFSATTTLAVAVNLGLTVPQIVNANLQLILNDEASFENVIGGSQNDLITGNDLDNQLLGGPGHDTLDGADGDDLLQGDAGDDLLIGGMDDDLYRFDADLALGHDTLFEANNQGTETLDFTPTTSLGVTVNLRTALAQIVNANLTLSLSHANRFENILGSAAADTLRGNDRPNRLEGGLGNDTYLLSGDWGQDQILEGSNAGLDRVDLSLATAGLEVTLGHTLLITSGSNSLTHSSAGIERLTGTSFPDLFHVQPTATAFDLQGGPGPGDELNYDALGLPTLQTATTLTTSGLAPVTFGGFETVTVLNPAPIPGLHAFHPTPAPSSAGPVR